jgi:uncharacterized protein (DUF427 family)
MPATLAAAESVWDYPRPPRLERTERAIRIVHRGIVLVETTRAMRILETSHPPVYYISSDDIAMEHLQPSLMRPTHCEFKGLASYWDIAIEDHAVEAAAWSYPKPMTRYSKLRDRLAFYAGRVDECSVDGEIVIPQAGDFYGGWITSHVSGPFKGELGEVRMQPKTRPLQVRA